MIGYQCRQDSPKKYHWEGKNEASYAYCENNLQKPQIHLAVLLTIAQTPLERDGCFDSRHH